MLVLASFVVEKLAFYEANRKLCRHINTKCIVLWRENESRGASMRFCFRTVLDSRTDE
jgi:hypothetical protein